MATKATTKKPSLILSEDVVDIKDDLTELSVDLEGSKSEAKDELPDILPEPTPEPVREDKPILETSVKGTAGGELAEFESLITGVDEVQRYLKMLVYGRNGSGKTYFAGTASDVLILATEDGTRTLKTRASHAKKVDIKDWATFEKAYWYLASGKHPYKTVVIDTITRLVQIALRHEIAESGKVVKEVVTATQKNYGDMSQRLQYWLTSLFRLPINFIILAQERTNSDDADLADYQGFPDMPRSVRNFVLGDMDIVARTYIGVDVAGNPQFRMMVGPNTTYWTKDRVGLPKGDFKTPSFEGILKAFND